MTAGSRSRRLPSRAQLARGLSSVLGSRRSVAGPVTVLDRKPNPYESTFPSEIVTCRLAGNGGRLRLFIKYGTKEFDGVYGHRGDVSYEAKVYRDVLQPLRTSTPTFYGLYRDQNGGVPWLIIEYLKGVQSSHSHDPNATVRAAEWIGAFHAANEPRLREAGVKFLRRYDAPYYLGWARRTDRLFAYVRDRVPWLSPMCREFRALVPRLLAAPKTVIHGEYFGLNIIYRNGICGTTDWQSAAIAPGEIDLASVTHSWPPEIVRKSERAYIRSRWPEGAPDDFEDILEAARVYMNLRWLGDPSLMVPRVGSSGRPIPPRKAKKFLKELGGIAEKIGVVA